MVEKWIEISKYRIKKAYNNYISAERNFKADDYETAANRAYYSIFHMMCALLILEGKDFKKHSAVISEFQKEYIKTGIFNKDFSNIVSDSSILRNNSDYTDMFFTERDDTEKQINNAKMFYDAVKSYIENLIAENR